MTLCRAHYAKGKTGAILAARLLTGTDLLAGIEQLCGENNIQSAVISSCFGSFQQAGYLYLVPNSESKVGAGYGELQVRQGPVEFLQGTGVVCKREGEYEIHFHGTMCDQAGNVFGGHLVKGENPVITVDLVLTAVEGMTFSREYDEETGGNQFYPLEHGRAVTNSL
ncbi:PPC domain-containing DNA-binding protein [Oceanobacillus sp. FSL K6-2867]|uniref:PPC domain-containing DNA-binding protein n=1 Tax=Oceanobacillus sp. FSL K6-2867 TaxID=2954748 RepID=UPI0030DB2570